VRNSCLRWSGLSLEATDRNAKSQVRRSASQRGAVPCFKIQINLLGNMIEPATHDIRFKLPIPLAVDELLKPLRESLKLIRRKALDCIFKLGCTHGSIVAQNQVIDNIL